MSGPNREFLLTHLEYAAWAVSKTTAMLDKLQPESITKPAGSSYGSILATLQHVHHCDKGYLVYMQGGDVEVSEANPNVGYAEIRDDLLRVHADIFAWAKDNLSEPEHDEQGGRWPVWRVIVQMVNHTTHHIGQIVTLARQAGYTPEMTDWTDISLFYLERYPPQQTAPGA
jgi:uncharacterized damage-inducible protein DinB